MFTARNIIYNISMSICGFLFGLWLEKMIFPGNYQILYAFGFATSPAQFLFLFPPQSSGAEFNCQIACPDFNPKNELLCYTPVEADLV